MILNHNLYLLNGRIIGAFHHNVNVLKSHKKNNYVDFRMMKLSIHQIRFEVSKIFPHLYFKEFNPAFRREILEHRNHEMQASIPMCH